MNSSGLEKYRKHVNKNLSQLKEMIAHFSSGDFFKCVDPSLINDDEFADIFVGLNSMADEFSLMRRDLEEKRNELKKLVKKRSTQVASLNKKLSRNILEQHLIEDALKDSEEKYRLLAELAQDFIFIVDRNLLVRYVNECGAMQLQRTPQEIIGRPLTEIFYPQIVERFQSSIEIVFATSQPIFRESKVDFPGEKEIWLETKLTPIPDHSGHIEMIFGISRDISERKKGQTALIERERFLSNIFSSILDGISILDKDLNILQVNPIMEKWYRHAMPIVGKKCYEAYHLRNKPCDICPSLKTLQTGKAAYEVVSKQKLKDESCGWLDLFTFPMMDLETGQIKGVIEYVRDITEKKQAEEELRRSEEKFRTLANTVSAGIAIVKKNRFHYANQYMLDAIGYTYDELKNIDLMEIIHPDCREIINQRQAARMRGEKVPSQLEYKVLLKDGTAAWVHQSAGLIEFEGEPATLVTVWDINEEKKIKQALADEKERLDVTLGSIDDGVISTDMNTNVITVNKAAEMLFGYSKEESIGRRLDDICCIIDEKTHKPNECIFVKMIEQYGVVNYKKHFVLRSRNGSDHHIDLSMSPIMDQNGAIIGIVLVFRDVTEKQKLENEIFKVRKLESLGVLAGGIAHDFNNILTGIITNLFMAKLTLPQSGENYRLLLDAEKACFRASRLTKQLLTFSKGGAPVKEIASIKEIIEETVGFCLSGSNAIYKLELSDDLMAANIDKGQIDQVINNLLINAQQAMPSGGVIIVKAENITIFNDKEHLVSARNTTLPPGQYIKVSIRDEGTGIPHKDIEKIFDPYFTTKPNGTGLGLTTSYSIIKNHDGIIIVDSEMGRGSVFSFYLPALDVSLEAGTKQTVSHKSKGGKILVMDDDDAVRTVVAQILKSYGFEVVCTSSGTETVQIYKRAFAERIPYDAVIMDLTVPGGMGGKEVVKILKEFDPLLKAIVTSGYSNDPIMANFKEYGFCGVIAKPFIIDEFLRVVKDVITSP